MEEIGGMAMTILMLIGLCFVIGVIMKMFNAGSAKEGDSNTDFMANIMGDGCGVIMIIFTLGMPILALLYYIFS